MGRSVLYLKGGLVSVIEEHEDGHLEGGDLKDVLPGVGARHLGPSHPGLRPVLLDTRNKHGTLHNYTPFDTTSCLCTPYAK